MNKQETGTFNWKAITLHHCVEANDPKDAYFKLHAEQTEMKKNNDLNGDQNTSSKPLKKRGKYKKKRKNKRQPKQSKHSVVNNYNKLKSKLNPLVYRAIFNQHIWSKSYTLKPEPNIGDWLLSDEGIDDQEGETFYEWYNDNHKLLPTDLENKIGLIPVPHLNFKMKVQRADIDYDSVYFIDKLLCKELASVGIELNDIMRELIDVYFGMKGKSVFGININKMNKKMNKMTECMQISTSDIHKRLAIEKKSEPDLFCLVGISMMDLYSEYGSFNFVYGAADSGRKTGCFSFARYLPAFYDSHKSEKLRALLNGKQAIEDDEYYLSPSEQSLFITRCAKVLCHEIGHLFGIQHCIYFQCIMNGANHMGEVDESPLYLCPICLNKLYFARIRNDIDRTTFDRNNSFCSKQSVHDKQFKFKLTTMDIMQRYQSMSIWCKKYGLKQEYNWYNCRIKLIQNK